VLRKTWTRRRGWISRPKNDRIAPEVHSNPKEVSIFSHTHCQVSTEALQTDEAVYTRKWCSYCRDFVSSLRCRNSSVPPHLSYTSSMLLWRCDFQCQEVLASSLWATSSCIWFSTSRKCKIADLDIPKLTVDPRSQLHSQLRRNIPSLEN
jgi:hypothetical protein